MAGSRVLPGIPTKAVHDPHCVDTRNVKHGEIGGFRHRVQKLVFCVRKLYENPSEKYKYQVHFLITNSSIES